MPTATNFASSIVCSFEDEETASVQTADLIKSQGGEAIFVKANLTNLDDIEA